MNCKLMNRLNQLEGAAPSSAAPVDQPEIPPGFTGTLFYNDKVQVWLPDNGRGPADQPKPNIVRIDNQA